MNDIFVEIRAGEGGDDAKLLVRKQVGIYLRAAKLKGWSTEIVHAAEGQLILKVSGADAFVFFENEAGGHRWQRKSPTDKRGRTHTSSVTVAVMKAPFSVGCISDKEIDVQLFRRSKGAGGQHNNKASTAVRMVHKPTGIRVECSSERSQKQNRATARMILESRVIEALRAKKLASQDNSRRKQIGSGMRGDKIRTYREQDDRVKDHRSNKKACLSEVLEGHLDRLK